MTDTDLRPPLDPEIDAVFRALPAGSRWRRTVGAKFGEIGLRRELVRAESVTDDELRYGGRIEHPASQPWSCARRAKPGRCRVSTSCTAAGWSCPATAP
jgi:hypothetical protein